MSHALRNNKIIDESATMSLIGKRKTASQVFPSYTSSAQYFGSSASLTNTRVSHTNHLLEWSPAQDQPSYDLCETRMRFCGNDCAVLTIQNRKTLAGLILRQPHAMSPLYHVAPPFRPLLNVHFQELNRFPDSLSFHLNIPPSSIDMTLLEALAGSICSCHVDPCLSMPQAASCLVEFP